MLKFKGHLYLVGRVLTLPAFKAAAIPGPSSFIPPCHVFFHDGDKHKENNSPLCVKLVYLIDLLVTSAPPS